MRWCVVDLDENIEVFKGSYEKAKEVFNEGIKLEVKVLLQKEKAHSN